MSTFAGFQDKRVREVAWMDLRVPTSVQVVKELLLSSPFLLGSWYCAGHALWIPALAMSFFFFLAGLRQVHNAFHHALGVPKWMDTGVMLMLSVLMLNSMHAVKFNHLLHHRHCLDEHDLEGASAHMPGWKVLLLGPLFPIQIHVNALRRGKSRVRAWVGVELFLIVVFAILVASLDAPRYLQYHLATMVIGQCLAEFFCVWTVHHGCDGDRVIARTLRSRFWNWCTFGMFYHLEHHLFPAVPTCNLGKLAQRLDAATPEWRKETVFEGSVTGEFHASTKQA